MHYGIDLHSNNFIIAHRNEKGNITTKKYNLIEEDLNLFKSRLTKDDVIAVESTLTSYYFYDEISPLVKEVKIVNPLRFKIIAESTNKNDKKDAKTILEFLEIGLIPEIIVPRKEVRTLRSLFSTYQILVRNKTCCKNRIYAVIKSNGITISKTDFFTKEGIKEISNYNFQEYDKIQIEILLKQIAILEDEIKILKNKILTFCVIFYKEIEILTTIPGISPFIALALMTDICDINNFANPKKLCSYFGIVPKGKSSNNKKWSGKITKKGRKLSRYLLSQMILHFIKSSKLYEEQYLRLKKEKCSGKAIIAMMRKLVVIIFNMLKNKEKYYYMLEKNYKTKLNQCLRIIDKVKKIDDKYIQEWENEIREKYDLKYKRKKLEKIA